MGYLMPLLLWAVLLIYPVILLRRLVYAVEKIAGKMDG